MKKTLALAAVALLVVSALAWSLAAIQDLRERVAGHSQRIEHLERR